MRTLQTITAAASTTLLLMFSAGSTGCAGPGPQLRAAQPIAVAPSAVYQAGDPFFPVGYMQVRVALGAGGATPQWVAPGEGTNPSGYGTGQGPR
jgi:hypothetical protein